MWKLANPTVTITEAIKTWIGGHLTAQNINNYAAGGKKGIVNDACSGIADCSGTLLCTSQGSFVGNRCTQA